MQSNFRTSYFFRVCGIALVGTALSLMSACGGGSGSSSTTVAPKSGVDLQTVAFGTSLSDAGTYSSMIATTYGGGRFTTNPGEVWAQLVSESFGHTLTPAYYTSLGLFPVSAGGMDYAQGGAQVSLGGDINTKLITQMPLTWQVGQYLSDHSAFNANQLVLIEGGANEILNFAQDSSFAAFGAAVAQNQATFAQAAAQLIANGQFPNTAAGQNQAMAAVIANFMSTNASTYPLAGAIIDAAKTMATMVDTQILGNGATHVVVADVPDIGQTPAGYAANQTFPGTAALLSAISGAYNITLMQGLQPSIATGKVIPIDTYSWLDSVIANYQSAGFSVSNTAIACNLDAIQAEAAAEAASNPSQLAVLGVTAEQFALQARSSLFCATKTLIAPNADSTYMFADDVHPTTALHAQFAHYVLQQMSNSGLGKAP